jgi:hypothetical protein
MILITFGITKAVYAATNMSKLTESDTVFGVPQSMVVASVSILEIVVGVLAATKHQGGLVSIAWLASCFGLYRLIAYTLTPEGQCQCAAGMKWLFGSHGETIVGTGAFTYLLSGSLLMLILRRRRDIKTRALF